MRINFPMGNYNDISYWWWTFMHDFYCFFSYRLDIKHFYPSNQRYLFCVIMHLSVLPTWFLSLHVRLRFGSPYFSCIFTTELAAMPRKGKPKAHRPQRSPECTATMSIFSQNTVIVACKKKITFRLPWQLIKFNSLDLIHLVVTGLLKEHYCKAFVKIP